VDMVVGIRNWNCLTLSRMLLPLGQYSVETRPHITHRGGEQWILEAEAFFSGSLSSSFCERVISLAEAGTEASRKERGRPLEREGSLGPRQKSERKGQGRRQKSKKKKKSKKQC